MTRPLLSLVMIVKNEVNSIREVITSARKACDHFTILDTGSTDGTWEILCDMNGPRDQTVLGSSVTYDGLPGRGIIDFAKTRNVVLEIEKNRPDAAVFTVMLSGDEVLQSGEKLREFLEFHREAADGAYRIDIRKGSGKLQYPRVLRVDANWRYRYAVHEMPFSPNGHTEAPHILCSEIVYSRPDQSRLFRRMKDVDLPVLEHMADTALDTHDDHLKRARALFHLASTHENLAEQYQKDDPGSPWVSHQMQAMAYYWRRADLDGDPNEKHFALFRYFDIAGKLGFIYTHGELVERLKMLAEMDPKRPETRYLLAMHASQVDIRQGAFFASEAARVAREAKEHPLPFPTDTRVEWLSLQIAAECAKKLEKPDRAKAFAAQAIEAGGPREAFQEYLG